MISVMWRIMARFLEPFSPHVSPTADLHLPQPKRDIGIEDCWGVVSIPGMRDELGCDRSRDFEIKRGITMLSGAGSQGSNFLHLNGNTEREMPMSVGDPLVPGFFPVPRGAFRQLEAVHGRRDRIKYPV